MMKKIASLAAAGALFAATVLPAMAYMQMPGMGWDWGDSGEVEVRNKASVSNHVMSMANSGENDVMGMCLSRVSIKTGPAVATSLASTDVNRTEIACDGCDSDVSVKNRVRVSNHVMSMANSGENDVMGMSVRGARLETGRADAYSEAWNVVNYTMVGDGMSVMPN